MRLRVLPPGCRGQATEKAGHPTQSLPDASGVPPTRILASLPLIAWPTLVLRGSSSPSFGGSQRCWPLTRGQLPQAPLSPLLLTLSHCDSGVTRAHGLGTPCSASSPPSSLLLSVLPPALRPPLRPPLHPPPLLLSVLPLPSFSVSSSLSISLSFCLVMIRCAFLIYTRNYFPSHLRL